MGSFSIAQWLIALAIVLLILGAKKVRNLGTDLAGARRGFKAATREGTVKNDP